MSETRTGLCQRQRQGGHGQRQASIFVTSVAMELCYMLHDVDDHSNDKEVLHHVAIFVIL